MAATDYPVNHPLSNKLWSKKMYREAIAKTSIMKFAGTEPDNMIQIHDDTQKAAGDRVRVPLTVQLTGRGVTQDEELEGNEESLVQYYDDLFINELRHAVRHKRGIHTQRVNFEPRKLSKDNLRDWLADRLDTWGWNALAGNTAVSDTIYTGFNSTTAPTSATGNRRIIYADEASTTEGSLTASQTFNLSMLDTAKNIAETSSPLIRPIRSGSAEYYCAFLHPNQVRSLRTNTNTGQWLDIQKQVLAGGDIEDNPIFTGALGVYNGIVLHSQKRLPKAPTNANTRRALFCGAQAASLAWGKGFGEMPSWTEEEFDYDKDLGVALETIGGLKKHVYNSIDFATIVITTWAADL